MASESHAEGVVSRPQRTRSGFGFFFRYASRTVDSSTASPGVGGETVRCC